MEMITLFGDGKWGIPMLKPLDKEIEKNIKNIEWFTFKDAKSHFTKDKDLSKCGINFYTDDKWFHSVWSSPYKYLDFFKQFACVHSPDFSTYIDYPLAVQMYNHYRSMWMGAWWQYHGIDVIPTIQFSDKRSWEFCFDGVPKNAAISFSTVGCWRDKKARGLMIEGALEMIKRLEPSLILWRGNIPDEIDFENIVKINEQGDLHFKKRHTNVKEKQDGTKDKKE